MKQKSNGMVTRRRWSDVEDDLVRKSYGKASLDWLSRTLGRSKNAIKVHARHLDDNLRMRPYTPVRDWTRSGGDAYIKQHYKSHTTKELAAALGVTRITVRKRMTHLGLYEKKKYCCRKWTKSDDKFLIKNYKKMQASDLADYFGVSPSTVYRRTKVLGLKKTNPRIWNKDSDEILVKNHAILSIKELASFFNTREQTVRKRETTLGLHRPKHFEMKKALYLCPKCKVFVLGTSSLEIVCGNCGKPYQPIV